MSNFSERLKLLRGNRNKAEFARFLGIPAPMYHRYENGQIPKHDYLSVISKKTGKTVDWLLGKDEPIDPAAAKWEARSKIQLLLMRYNEADLSKMIGADVNALLSSQIPTSAQDKKINAIILGGITAAEAKADVDTLPGICRQLAILLNKAAEIMEKKE